MGCVGGMGPASADLVPDGESSGHFAAMVVSGEAMGDASPCRCIHEATSIAAQRRL